ncbi:MarR family transcriptional regulator [Conexibacter sp. W3-3-2]|nr:MarR family transcriptional regulator [Conexibacter sp. W3-3-2]
MSRRATPQGDPVSTRITQVIETLEAERAQLASEIAELQGRLEYVEVQLRSFRDHAAQLPVADAPASPSPEKARHTKRVEKASRARKRRAEIKPLRRDLVAEVVAFLRAHPGSTAGDIARGLDVSASTVSAKIKHLTQVGQVVKAQRGYALPPEAEAEGGTETATD